MLATDVPQLAESTATQGVAFFAVADDDGGAARTPEAARRLYHLRRAASAERCRPFQLTRRPY
jgi:hypothetical protein